MKKLPLYLLIVVVVAAIVLALRVRTGTGPDDARPPAIETLPIAPDLDSLPPDSVYFGQVQSYRDEVVAFLKGEESPLDDADLESFVAPRFFPIDPAYRFRIRAIPPANADTLILMDTKGAERQYVPHGVLRFQVDGREQQLQLFKEPKHGYLFLPFRDATSGPETYDVGRYVEPVDLGNGVYLVDFNLAYNPYCAYNYKWACPIPPESNHLESSIRAGEMKYHTDAP